MKIILGKSQTGKSTKIYEMMEEDQKNGKRPILFVPSQMREITELSYMREEKKEGIIHVTITTIAEYVSLLLKKKNLHLEESYLSKLDKKLLVSKLIKQKGKNLRLFQHVQQKEGFLELIHRYMEIFRKNQITEETLQNTKLKNKRLESKLQELGELYFSYEETIKDTYIDDVSEINRFNEKIDCYQKELENTTIYFDGYNNFTKPEFELITSFLKLRKKVTIALNTDITCIEDVYSNQTNDIFEETNQTYVQLLHMANSINEETVENVVLYPNFSGAKESLQYLTEYLFEPVKAKRKFKEECVKMNVYSNVYKEAEAVAYQICQKRKEGYRYNDFCIYTTDMASYESVLARTFYEYGIPLYVDTKRKIQCSRLTEYIIELLEMATLNLNFDGIVNLLKKGLNGFDLEDLAYLENYLLEFHIHPYQTHITFHLNNQNDHENEYDLERLNHIKEKAVSLFSDVVKKLKEASQVKEMVSIIYEHLVKEDIFLTYYELSEKIGEKAYFLYSSKADFKIWEQITEVFDSIDKIYENTSLNVSEFYQLFQMAISEVYTKSVPPTKDKVILADINRSKVGQKRISFFIGVVEGDFPKKYEEDLLFQDREIEELNQYGIALKETSIAKENMGKYNIYEALGHTKEYLYLSMPSVNIKNETTRKSFIIREIENLLTIKMVGEVTSTKDLEIQFHDIYSKEKCFEFMIKKLRFITEQIEQDNILTLNKAFDEQIQELFGIYDYFLYHKQYQEILFYLKKDDNLSQENMEHFYQKEFKSSVYKLEQFKKCPFAYYLKYILEIKKRKVYEMNAMDTGSLMHQILDGFSKDLMEHQIKWSDILDEEEKLKNVYHEKLVGIMNELLSHEFKKQQESVKYGIYKRKLENTMTKVIGTIAKSFRQSDFEVFGNEIAFNDHSLYLPIVLTLDQGIKMKIIGKIDRVDIYEEEGKSYIRVVDYKSSKKTLTIDDIKEGISLQLITYMTAMLQKESKGQKMIPAACLYMNLSDSLIKLKDYTKDQEMIKNEVMKKLRMNGLFLKDIHLLEKMDKYVSDSSAKLIDITTNRMENSKKILEESDFVNLCEEAKELLKKIGEEMVKGVVKINPNKKKEACKYCDFSSVCRKDSCL